MSCRDLAHTLPHPSAAPMRGAWLGLGSGVGSAVIGRGWVGLGLELGFARCLRAHQPVEVVAADLGVELGLGLGLGLGL
eukprot:scaffold37445_cov22-Phaeocystis_antarctica.AAC.1